MWDDLAPPKPKANAAGWMLTFTDLVGLLICFFVMMFSMKTLDKQMWDQLTGSFRGTFAPTQQKVIVPPSDLGTTETRQLATSDGLNYLQALLVRRLGADAVWRTMLPTVQQVPPDATGVARLRYQLPTKFSQAQNNASGISALASLQVPDAEALRRLADVVRNWDNKLILVARIDVGNPLNPAATLAAVAQALARDGAPLERSEIAPATPEAPAGLWLEVRGIPPTQ